MEKCRVQMTKQDAQISSNNYKQKMLQLLVSQSEQRKGSLQALMKAGLAVCWSSSPEAHLELLFRVHLHQNRFSRLSSLSMWLTAKVHVRLRTGIFFFNYVATCKLQLIEALYAPGTHALVKPLTLPL